MRCKERSILHLNVADFSVAVEQVVDSSLKGKPVIISHSGANRAVVHDMSDEAFRDGVRKGMPLNQATKRSRRAQILPPRFELYRRAMSSFTKEACNFSPLVEHGVDDGHLYIDITGTHKLFGPPPDVGLRLQREIRNRLSLHPIWTYSANKLVAKVASRLVKPVGEYIVAPGEEADFLAPLSTTLLPGLHKKEVAKIKEFNLSTIGTLAVMTPEQLSIPFGKRAAHIHEISRGIDRAPVQRGNTASKALHLQHYFVSDTNDRQEIESTVFFLTTGLTEKLRSQGIAARRVGVWLGYSDGVSSVRSATSKRPSSQESQIKILAHEALQRAWIRRVRVRSIQVSCDLFQTESRQLSLFDHPVQRVHKQREQKVVTALDTIRKKFGNCSIICAKQQPYKTTLQDNRCLL